MNKVIMIIFIIVAAFFLFGNNKEGFKTNQKIELKSPDGLFVSKCLNKHLCLVNESNKTSFSIFKFADDLLALESEGYYITACFGDDCDESNGKFIKIDSFNPYAPNAKFKLVPNGTSYYLQLYNGQYIGVDENKHFVSVTGRDKAISLEFV